MNLIMNDATRNFLEKHCADIPFDREHLNDLLDRLDEMELNSLDAEYNPTESTRPIVYAIDDLWANNGDH